MPGMMLETVKLRGTELNRVGAQSRITMLGLPGMAFSGGENLLCRFGSNAGSPRLREQGRFSAEIVVYPRFPPICFSFKWSNWVIAIGLSVKFSIQWLLWWFLQKT